MKAWRPLKAIRAKCLECSNNSSNEVRLCPCAECPLYAYRFGHKPKGMKLPAEDADEEKTRTQSAVTAKDGHLVERMD